jgi:protein-tyrosine phosphatase
MTSPIPAGTVPSPRDPDEPYRILMVCLGNICRSPMAEVLLRAELDRAGLGGKVTVDSAGTGDWHKGEPMDERAAAELARRGYDGSRHRARQIQSSWLQEYDLLVAMDQRNFQQLSATATGFPGLSDRIAMMRSFDPNAAADAEVPDPYSGSPEDYTTVFDLILPAAQALATSLAAVL